jgi:uncharacterized membrane protein YhaH (DUF805 family)
MKKYYYLSGSDRVGPVTLEELKLVKGLTSETLLWYEGLASWVRAGELSDVLTSVPPPVPPVAGNMAAPPVPPNQSSRELFAHPFSFKGRIRRLEFGLSGVINLCATLLADFILGDNEVFSAVGFIYWSIAVVIAWFGIAQGAKRSHDFGKSGWWQLLYLGTLLGYVLPLSMWYFIPMCCLPTIIFVSVLLFYKGDAGNTVYGTDPKSNSNISKTTKSLLIGGAILIAGIILAFKFNQVYNQSMPNYGIGRFFVPAATVDESKEVYTSIVEEQIKSASTPAVQELEKTMDLFKLLRVNNGTAQRIERMMNSGTSQSLRQVSNVETAHRAKWIEKTNVNDLIFLCVPAYYKYYTHDEIKQLIGFHELGEPMGEALEKKVREVTPLLSAETSEIGIKWSKKLHQDIGEELYAEGWITADELRTSADPSIQEVSKKMDIVKYFRESGKVQVFEQTIRTMLPQLRQNTNLPDIFWIEAKERMRVDDIVYLLAPVYDKYYTHDEIRRMIKYDALGVPDDESLARKVKEVNSLVVQESTEIGRRWGERIEQEILAYLSAAGYYPPLAPI